MKIKKAIAVLLMLALMIPLPVFGTDGEDTQAAWAAEDFTYGEGDLESQFTIMPATNTGDKLTGTIHVITGLSESGTAKIETNKDLVIPSEDPEGNKVQGIGASALSGLGIKTIQLPENVKTDNNGKWDPFVRNRGDFFIGSSALSSNELTDLTLPEGVLYVGGTAFKNNKLKSVRFPSTIMMIANSAFGANEIEELSFPDETDFPLQIDNMAFYQNQIKEAYLPARTEKVSKWAFFRNTGMEPVVYGTDQEKQGGIVYFYVTDPGRFIEDTVTGKSNVQKMFAEYTDPSGEEGGDEGGDEVSTDAWTAEDFTFGEYEKRLYGCDYSRDFTIKGTAVTGFSEAGEAKLETNKNLVIPAKDNEGKTIVGVGPNAFKNKGIESVKFPTGMLVNYNDTVTYRITKRGNFVIAEGAFSGNNLTSVNLPDGVIAVLGQAFSNNKLTTVTLPKTIWWVETYAFGKNQISKVIFPETTYFAFEMHGWPFAENRIKSVRLPDCTAVVNKYAFQQNPGMEKLSDSELRQAYSTPVIADTVEEQVRMIKEADQDGIVYMYADVIEMADLDRIHHYDKSTGSTHSWFQKLIINDGTPATQNPDGDSWNINDFTVSGTTITGLSASGIEKRKTNKNLVIPDYNSNAELITEIAAASAASTGGLFATSDEKIESVTLPSGLKKIGDNAFREAGLSDVAFPPEIEEIGEAAFQMNSLSAVVLPDTVTKLGKGAFASNKTIEKIILSSGLKEIPEGAFGCSDGKNWMRGLTEIEIPYGVTKICSRAFAGNNFHSITVPEGVTEIGSYAFSTKNYLLLDDNTECTVVLPKTLEKLGDRAFRNKKVAEIEIPESVESIGKNTFEKVLSTYGTPDIPGSMVYELTTKVFLRNKGQYEDKTRFPDSKFHEIYFTGFEAWEPDDFTYGDAELDGSSLHMVTGLSESGEERLALNKELAVPEKDPDGNAVEGVGDDAFKGIGLTAVRLSKPAAEAAAGKRNVLKNMFKALDGHSGLIYIGKNAFANNSLAAVEIPEGVVQVDDNAFKSNSVSNVSFPVSIEIIGSGSFEDNNISGLRFTEETETPLKVYSRAFANNKIKAVQLPAKTSIVKDDAFAENKGKSGVVSLYVIEPGEEVVNSATQEVHSDEVMPAPETWQPDDFEYSADGSTLLGFSEYGKERLGITHDVVLPDTSSDGVSITQIASGAFAVDDEDVDVGKYDFATDKGIASLVLPKDLEKIGDYAFEYNSLQTIDFSRCSKISEIGVSAFHGNKLTKVELPDSVIKLGGGAFSANNINTLRLSSGVTVIPQGAFSMNIRLAHIDIPDTVTEIGDMAFAGARLTTLDIPASVTKIGRKAFHLHHLTSLTIPGTVKEIGESAFEGTYKAQTLRNLELGEGIEIIGKYAFKEGLLTKVILPDSLKTMGYEPFINNTGTDANHVVILGSYNPAHMAFNEGALYHRVIDQAAEDARNKVEEPAAVEQPAPSEVLDGSLPKVKLSKPKAGKKKVTVKWKKLSKKNKKKIQGIEVRIVGPGKEITVAVGKKKTSKKIGGLKSGKKYKVQARTYKYVGNVKHVSAWKTKTVKAK